MFFSCMPLPITQAHPYGCADPRQAEGQLGTAWHRSAAIPPPGGHGGLTKGEQNPVLELCLLQNPFLEVGVCDASL